MRVEQKELKAIKNSSSSFSFKLLLNNNSTRQNEKQFYEKAFLKVEKNKRFDNDQCSYRLSFNASQYEVDQFKLPNN